MIRLVSFIVLATLSVTITFAQKKKEGFRFIDHIDKKQIDLEYNGKVMTSYCYYDSLMKPILFPLNTVSGVTVTRGFPLEPRPGERVDHPHHTGMWLNYESVNGLDFWNNSTAIPYNLRSKYGSIIHDRLVKTEYDAKRALLEVTARWVNKKGDVLLHETTRYHFSINETDFVIDRVTTLTAVISDVTFKDIKDGFLGIRVARELEHPSTEPETILDAQGNPTRMPVVDNKSVTGEYLSSEGLKGNEVWGTRGRWVRLKGRKNGKQVSITIIDHPKNVGYPTYWHARGYGLFAANPLGQEIFSKGKEKLNFSLKAGESTTFRYRVLLHDGELLSDDEVNKLAKQFSKLN